MTPETARLTSEIEAERAKLRELRRDLWAHGEAMEDVRVAETMLNKAAFCLRAGWPTRAQSAISSAAALRKAAETRRETGGGA